MFHDADVKLPRFVGTKTPEDVAAAVVRAIEHDRAEVDVAPLGMRAGAAFAGLAPELSARAAAPARRREGRRGHGPRPARQARLTSGVEPGVVRPEAERLRVQRAGAAAARRSSSTSRVTVGEAGEDLVGEPRPVAVLDRRGGDAHDDLVGVELLERDARLAADRRLDRVLEQRLDVARAHVGAQPRAQVDRGGLAQRHDGGARARRCWGP